VSEGGFSLEAATLDDVAALYAIERRSYSHPWSERSLHDAVADPSRARVVVLRSGARSGGERGILAYGVFQVAADELHVHNLAVRPESRGRHLGRRLLELILELGVRRGAAAAFLEVRAGNQAARSLYASVGFEQIDVRRGYYEAPREDALVLRKALTDRGAAAFRTPSEDVDGPY
jgi:ribosomal-protein-alanine N-acetyltransferase